MYRRRRASREKILFSFDSFLDVVANVNGIIIRLILVAWVGARAYHATTTLPDETTAEPDAPIASAAPLPDPRAEDEPLTPELARQRDRLAEARRLLAAKVSSSTEGRKRLEMVSAQLTSLSRSQQE